MKIASGKSLPIVSTFTTKLLCRMPRMLIAARIMVTVAIRAARGAPTVIAGQ